jgi:hypothetical protein
VTIAPTLLRLRMSRLIRPTVKLVLGVDDNSSAPVSRFRKPTL